MTGQWKIISTTTLTKDYTYREIQIYVYMCMYLYVCVHGTLKRGLPFK